MNRSDLLEEVQHLTRAGESPQKIADRLGITPASVARSLYRSGRGDLAAPFERLRSDARRHPCEQCGKPGVWYHRRVCTACSYPQRNWRTA